MGIVEGGGVETKVRLEAELNSRGEVLSLTDSKLLCPTNRAFSLSTPRHTL